MPNPPNPARVAFDFEQLATIPPELGGPAGSGAQFELILRPAPDLILQEDVRFEVRLDGGNYPARPPTVRCTTEVRPAVDLIDAGGAVNLPLLDARAEPNGWSRGYTCAVVFYALRDLYKKPDAAWMPPPPRAQSDAEPAAGRMHEKGPDVNFELVMGHAGAQGKRMAMEDVVLTQKLNLPAKKTSRAALVVVFDGHGGRKVAEWASELLPEHLRQNLRVDGWAEALQRAFPTVDAELRRRREALSAGRDASGSTVLATLFDGKDTIHVASLGDCRAVLADGSRRGYANCSSDCRADRPDEVARVVGAGGFVANKRVNGQIAVSRALGDFAFKGGNDGDRVSCVPDVTTIKLREGDDFLLIGCDGVFDVLSSAEAITFARDRLKGARSLDDAAMDLVRHAIDDRDSRDNVSVCLVKFQKASPEVYTGTAVAASHGVPAEPMPLGAGRPNAPRPPPPKRSGRIVDDEDLMEFLMDGDNFA